MEKIDKSITYVFTKRVELQEAELNTIKEFEYSYSHVKNLSSNARYIGYKAFFKFFFVEIN